MKAKAVHIRNVPSEVIAALKARAKRHHRSLEGELRELLAAAARVEDDRPPFGGTEVEPGRAAGSRGAAGLDSGVAELPPLELKFSSAAPDTSWSREEIYGDDGR